jgi:hypothetical protein
MCTITVITYVSLEWNSEWTEHIHTVHAYSIQFIMLRACLIFLIQFNTTQQTSLSDEVAVWHEGYGLIRRLNKMSVVPLLASFSHRLL